MKKGSELSTSYIQVGPRTVQVQEAPAAAGTLRDVTWRDDPLNPIYDEFGGEIRLGRTPQGNLAKEVTHSRLRGFSSYTLVDNRLVRRVNSE